jgi:hypothetical protein
MAYGDLEDRDMELESDLFEDNSAYDRPDTFGEQIGETSDENAEFEDHETGKEHIGSTSEQSSVEDAFGETINHTQNPHLADQLDDSELGQEANADYSKEEQEE